MRNKKLRCICEGAVCVALALVLSYLKIRVAALGGSIDLVMIPLIIFAVRWGLGWGLGAGLVFGTLKFFLAGGTAINWQSMLLDYSVAYMFVGFAGMLRNRWEMLSVAALIGCFFRFAVHFISGVTIYAIVEPTEAMGVVTGNAALFSLLYNISYMLPNTILAVAVCGLLVKPMKAIAKRYPSE